MMVYEDSSDDSSSSSDGDDLDLLLVNTMFPSTVKWDFPRLKLMDLSDAQCEAMFRKVLSFCAQLFLYFMHGHWGPEWYYVIHRFQKEDMERLLHALELPVYYECVQRTKCTGMEALMILLRRLVYPNRWCDLVPVFRRDEPQLSLIFNKVMKQ